MRQVFTLLFLFYCGITFAQSNLKFEKDTIDVGTITIETDSLGHEILPEIKLDFPFVNSGNEPLIITSASGNGSATAEYPKNPIIPKQKGVIKAKFTRFRYTGYLKKDEDARAFVTSIMVQGNFPEKQKFICIKGFVKKIKKK